MTNHWIDYQHSDVFLCIGLNTAENHPVSMKWIQKAKDVKGAKLITVDPRFTRTAAVSDIYAPIRPGTNTAFLSGLINYALVNGMFHQEYVVNYTNASYLVNPEYTFNDGLFSGAQDINGQTVYDKSSWSYQTDADGQVLKDESLENPNCVFQLMKRHYSRYTLSMVSRVTGCPVDKLREVAEVFCSTGQPGKAGNIMYAMGITQFTHGAQNVRSIAILQLLLGNMGIAGGGVNAQRGQSNVQGSTDMAMLYHIIPGYMAVPHESRHATLADYHRVETPKTSYWANKPKFFNSLLKAFWGENAQQSNDFCYDYFPKLDKNRSHIAMYKYMGQNEVKGMICWADNPAVGGPTASRKRKVSSNLDWQVVVDIFENETATFWKEPGVDPEEVLLGIQNAVFPWDVCVLKNEVSLNRALGQIEKIRDEVLPLMGASDVHCLVELLEVKNMTLIAEAMLKSSLMRTESRASHYREDYPKLDNNDWLKWILVSYDGDKLKLKTKPLPFEKYKFKPERYYSDNFYVPKQ